MIDNRQKASGDTETSEFYQIAGRRIQPGMLMEQHNDLGLGVFAGYKSGALGGFNANVDLLRMKSAFRSAVENNLVFIDDDGQAYLYYGGGGPASGKRLSFRP